MVKENAILGKYWILDKDMPIFVKNLTMKVLIHEETAESSAALKLLCVKRCPRLEVADESTSLEEVGELHKKKEYNVIFLNLDSSKEQVFNFLKTHAFNPTKIVITSSKEEDIIEAHEYLISGFLAKPFNEEFFNRVMDKIQKVIKSCDDEREEFSHFKEMIDSGKINRIALTTLEGFIIVHYNDIIRCEANGNYTSVYFHDGSFMLLTKTLKHYASKLEEHGFFRVHKTHLVNMSFVRSYVKGKNSYVELKDGSNIEVSSRKKQILVEKLNG